MQRYNDTPVLVFRCIVGAVGINRTVTGVSLSAREFGGKSETRI